VGSFLRRDICWPIVKYRGTVRKCAAPMWCFAKLLWTLIISAFDSPTVCVVYMCDTFAILRCLYEFVLLSAKTVT